MLTDEARVLASRFEQLTRDVRQLYQDKQGLLAQQKTAAAETKAAQDKGPSAAQSATTRAPWRIVVPRSAAFEAPGTTTTAKSPLLTRSWT